MLTYSLNDEWFGECPVCAGVTQGENVSNSTLSGDYTTRIYAVCEACGWEGLGVNSAAPAGPWMPAPTAGVA